ncbi:Siderophore iron transporter mirC [Yarrowia sp. B02]|nr:Siderophore iron transporter mirC [Yarrowia sp. B02]
MWAQIKHALYAPKPVPGAGPAVVENPTTLQKIFNPPVKKDDEPIDEDAAPNGSQEMAKITSLWNRHDLWMAWGSMLLIAVALALQGRTFNVYSTFATSEFEELSLLSSLAVTQAVINVAATTVFAKLADVLGRFESFLLSVVFFTIGFIMLAVSPNIATYFAAHIFYVSGSQGITFLQQVFAADTSSLRNRLFFVVLPNVCYIFVPWCAAPITNAVIKHSTWRWGYGMWCIIVPVVSIPVLTILFRLKMKAKSLNMAGGKSVRNAKETLRQFDFIGLTLLTAGLALLFLAVTLVKTSKSWTEPHVLAMVIIGPILLVLFPIWEKFPKYPFLPMKNMKNRTLITGCVFAGIHAMATSLYNPYYMPWLLVCKGLSVTAATNASATLSVSYITTTVIAAFIIRYTRRVKPCIVAGSCIYTLGLGLTYHYRQPDVPLAKFIVTQAVEGVGNGLLQSPALVLTQSSMPKHLVISATAIYYTINQIGRVVGDAISGSLYRQEYPKRLAEFAPFMDEKTVQRMVNDVKGPLKFAWGSEERNAIIEAFNHVYRKMLYGPMIIAAVGILIALTFPNINMSEMDNGFVVEEAEEDMPATATEKKQPSESETDEKKQPEVSSSHTVSSGRSADLSVDEHERRV